jgi:uncharacterized membrane protein
MAMGMALHWRLILGAAVGIVAWLAATLLGAPEPSRILIGWNAGAGVYLAAIGYLFMTATETQVRDRCAIQDETRGMILVLVIASIIAALAAIIVALVAVKDPHSATGVLVAALAAATLVTAWLVLQSVFVAHYTHRHFQAVAAGDTGFIFPGDPARTYMDFLYMAFCVGATAQISDPSVPTTRLRNLVTAHAATAYFYNTAILAVGINILAGLVGR